MALRLPVVDEPPSASLPGDGRRQRIHPADVRGRFRRSRVLVQLGLIAFWAALPWLHVGGHPAVMADVQSRQLFLFGLTFNPQDTWLLFFLVTGVAFGLVYATALAGRVWCGWACPQTVFLEGVYRRVERWIEGPREERLRRNARPVTLEKVARKTATHAAFAAISVLLAHVVLSYFVSLPAAFAMVRRSPSAHPEAFAWTLVVTGLLYVNFAWFREQFCVVMCPYGRLQGALLDEDSLVIGYDTRRGEPRGKKGTAGAGDCVDCKRCVVVCPTGIDIRNGMQMECLACTACIDACDEIMDKLGRPRGLVRYDSLRGFAGQVRRVVRPRVILYSVLLVVGAGTALAATGRRKDFEAALGRLPGEPYALEASTIRDALQVHIVNKRAEAVSYRIDVEPAGAMSALVPMSTVEVPALADARIPIFLTMSRDDFTTEFPVRVRVARVDDAAHATVVTARFLGPAR